MKALPKLCLSVLMLAGSLTLAPKPIEATHNPCHNLDNPLTGCYRLWNPQTLCCRGNGRPNCPTICL